jgi:hypothetical protein
MVAAAYAGCDPASADDVAFGPCGGGDSRAPVRGLFSRLEYAEEALSQLVIQRGVLTPERDRVHLCGVGEFVDEDLGAPGRLRRVRGSEIRRG